MVNWVPDLPKVVAALTGAAKATMAIKPIMISHDSRHALRMASLVSVNVFDFMVFTFFIGLIVI
jgi:hypothetical protein